VGTDSVSTNSPKTEIVTKSRNKTVTPTPEVSMAKSFRGESHYQQWFGNMPSHLTNFGPRVLTGIFKSNGAGRHLSDSRACLKEGSEIKRGKDFLRFFLGDGECRFCFRLHRHKYRHTCRHRYIHVFFQSGFFPFFLSGFFPFLLSGSFGLFCPVSGGRVWR